MLSSQLTTKNSFPNNSHANSILNVKHTMPNYFKRMASAESSEKKGPFANNKHAPPEEPQLKPDEPYQIGKWLNINYIKWTSPSSFYVRLKQSDDELKKLRDEVISFCQSEQSVLNQEELIKLDEGCCLIYFSHCPLCRRLF